MNAIPPVFLRQKQIEDMINMPRSTMYLKIKNGEFPRPRKVGSCSYWSAEEVYSWADELIRARDQ